MQGKKVCAYVFSNLFDLRVVESVDLEPADRALTRLLKEVQTLAGLGKVSWFC